MDADTSSKFGKFIQLRPSRINNYDYPGITGGITLTFSSVELASIDKPLANGGVATDRLYDVGQVIGTRHADILRGSQ